MADKFQVGDRVKWCSSHGTVTRVHDAGIFEVHYDDGAMGSHSPGSSVSLIAPAPPVTPRPIQPGDYIKDPGARPAVPAAAWAIGDLMVWVGATDHGLVYRVDRFDYGSSVHWLCAGADARARRSNACHWVRLPPDAILDVERSPKRDGDLQVTDGEFKTVDDKEALRKTIDKALASDGNRVRPCPADCAKATRAEWAEAIAKVNAHAALLSRALILVSGLNLQHHAVTRAQFETAQGLCRDLVRVLKPGRG